jgi:two-component system, NarL family, sensor histidine kinase DesK
MESPDIMAKKRNQRWAWLWLSYSGFLFINPIFEPSRFQWLGTLIVFAIFVVIFSVYINDRNEDRPIRYWLIAAIFLLGLATFPWNSGGSTLFVYAAAFLPFVVESAAKVLSLFVVESLFIVAEGYLFNTRGHLFYIGWPNVFFAIFLLVLIGAGNIFFAEQKRADCKLRRAQEENVALAAVAERERIARDLHDVLGHTLSVIVLKAELAGRLLQLDPERAAQEIADVERTARTALSEVREAIGGYRSQGLTAEMEQARKTLQSAGVALSCESPIPQLNPAEETVLCLAVREAITNIVRHAQAAHCRMTFTISDDGFYTLLITDDGGRANLQEGNGLRGMRERVQSLGGRLSVTADPGVTLRIELPPSSMPRPVEGTLATL